MGNLYYLFNYFSTDALIHPEFRQLFGQPEIYSEFRGNVLGEIGMNLATYLNENGIPIFQPFLHFVKIQLVKLADYLFRDGVLLKNIDYKTIIHPTRTRKISNIPDIKTLSYVSNLITKNGRNALSQSVVIKEDSISISDLEAILRRVNKKLIDEVVPFIPNIPEITIEPKSIKATYQKIENFRNSLFQMFGSVYGSEIFKQITKSAGVRKQERQVTPLICGYFNASFIKSLFCESSGRRGSTMKNRHIFDVHELRKEGKIRSRTRWDGTLSNCPICGEELIPLPGEVELKHFYLTDSSEIPNELITSLINEAVQMGSNAMKLLNSIYMIEIKENIGFEGLLPYPTRIDFMINGVEYYLMIGEPSTKQMINGIGIMPFIISRAEGKITEKYLSNLLEESINGSGGKAKTKSLADELGIRAKIKKINEVN